MAEEVFIAIESDGRMQAIYSDALADLLEQGTASTRRASNVEPCAAGGWQADMSPMGGPMLTGFALRGQALAAEVAWLRQRLAA